MHSWSPFLVRCLLHRDRILGIVASLPLKLSICGTFKRDVPQISLDFEEFRIRGCEVLSPETTQFVAEDGGFVFTQNQIGKSPHSIEQTHLNAIVKSDFVWLHCPDGYLGVSGARELGFAEALSVPVFARRTPYDDTFRALVKVVASPLDAIEYVKAIDRQPPSKALDAFKVFYRRFAEKRGWTDESVSDTMIRMTEELGELARAISTYNKQIRRKKQIDMNAAEELVDIIFYSVHLANLMNISLGAAAIAKAKEL